MTTDKGLLAGFRDSELWQFLDSAFKNYPQFILAFIASSGFISVFVYLLLFGLNAIDIISTSDIVFNAIVNLFLLLPVYAVIAILAALWVALDNAVDGTHHGLTGALFAAIRYGRGLLLGLAVVVFLIGVIGAIWAYLSISPGQTEDIRFMGYDVSGLIHATLLGLSWLEWLGAAAGILLVWLIPLVYARLTSGLLPKGLLTALVVFTISNTLIGSAAHYLYGVSSQHTELGFMRRHASNLPAQIEEACPGERDIIWTGDKALAVLCRVDGRRFIFYREYGTVVEKD